MSARKLYKVDCERWTVREVTGTGWPEADSEGTQIYDNTHFVIAADAWAKLEREATAYVELAGNAVREAREKVAQYERNAANACIALETARRNRRAGTDGATA